MPTPRFQLNVTLDIPLGEEIERLSKEQQVAEGRVGRILLEQRLALEKAGWKCEDKEFGEILNLVASLDEKGRKELIGFLKRRDVLPGEEA